MGTHAQCKHVRLRGAHGTAGEEEECPLLLVGLGSAAFLLSASPTSVRDHNPLALLSCLQHNPSSPHSSLLGLSRFIMPRGHKSKQRARQKRPQGRGDKHAGEVAQEGVAPTAEAAAAEVEAPPAEVAEAATPEQGVGAEAAEVEAVAEAAAVEAATPEPAAKAEAAAAAAGGKQEEEKQSTFSQGPCGATSCSPRLKPRRKTPSPAAPSADGSGVSSDNTCKNDERISEASHCPDYMAKDTECPIEALEWFILNKFHLKQPFTRLEMVLSVNRKYRIEFPEIFNSAREHLEMIFAVEMREVESTRHSYNLFSMLNLPNNGRVHPGRGYPKTGLLMKILALILMKGHRASEEDIWKFLRRMQVYPDMKHIFFGNVNRLLNRDFVRLKYLEYRQVPGRLLPRREFLWGPQAHAETSKEKIMQFLIRIHNMCPMYFSYLYEDLGKEEIEKFQASLSAKHVSTGKPRAVSPATQPAAPAKPIDV
ncbi:melanoma-associated antigen B3-like [Cavia porcellus]|uniref:melanoma-associated antigen B3-like n=1 Tax=Cavia porcellus TaxID=10141 RepID=UPI002FE0C928